MTEQPEAPPNRLRSRIRPATIALLLVGLNLILAFLLFDPALFTGGDNSRYMILAEALRTGEGYRDLYLPGSPLHTKYPPGYPVLLAALGWIGGVQLFKLASVLLSAGTVWLTFVLARRLHEVGVALLAATVVALNPVLLEYAHLVLSEALFGLLVIACLVALTRPADGESEGFVWLGASLAAAAFLTRTAGLALVVAVIGILGLRAMRRRTVGAWMPAVGLVAVMAGWFVYQRIGTPGDPGYLGELLLVNPYEPEAGRLTVAGVFSRAAVNFWSYLTVSLPSLLGGAARLNAAATALGIIAGAAVLAGWLAEAGARVRLATLFLPLYIMLILLWPSVWTDARFLLPVLPLLAIYALAGARSLSARLWPGTGNAAVATMAVLFLALGAMSTHKRVPVRRACQLAWQEGKACLGPGYVELLRAAAWARDSTPAGAIVASRQPALFYLGSGRQGDVYTFSSVPEVVLRDLEELGATYVLVGRTSITTPLYLAPAVDGNPDRFRPVFQDGSTILYEFLYGQEARAGL
ncbi:MAG: hypothetical protein ABFS14_03520 [Gemmatimonadota bacterium]